MSSLITPIHHPEGSSSQHSNVRKRKKSDTDCEKKIKLSVFTDDMTVYAENFEEQQQQKKALELINDYRRLQDARLRHKINCLH